MALKNAFANLATEPKQDTLIAAVEALATNQGSVTVLNFPSTQAISAASLPLPTGAATELTLAAINTKLGAALAVSGPLTDTQLRASAVPVTLGVSTVSSDITDRAARLLGHVTVDNLPGTQPVSGSVSVTNFPATQPVSGTISVGNFPAIQPVSQSGAWSTTVTGASNAGDAQAGSGALPTLAYNSVYNGATWDRLRGDATNGVWVNVKTSVLPTGASTETTLAAVNTKLGGTLTSDITDRAARLLGHVTIDNASLPVTGTFWQATQPVSAATLPLPAGAATETTLAAVNTKLAGTLTVDTELPAAAALADATANPTTPGIGAFNSIFNGATWDRLRTALGANTGTLSQAGDSLVVTGTGAALNATPIAATDSRAYRFLTLQLTGDASWNGTVTWEGSNDNSNWQPMVLTNAASSAATGANNSTVGAATSTTFTGPTTYRYIRVRVSTYTAGTVTATALFTALPSGSGGGSGGGGGVVDTELPAAAALADATANPTTPLIGAALQAFNGTTWDRLRGDTINGLRVNTPPDTPASGALTTVGQTVVLAVPSSARSWSVSVSGTYTGVTALAEVSFDGGTTWAATLGRVATASGSGSTATVMASSATVGVWLGDVLPGVTHVRCRISAITSGTANVQVTAGQQAMTSPVVLAGGQITGASSAGDAQAGSSSILTVAYNEVYNGSTWDRVRSAAASFTAVAPTGVQLVTMGGMNGAGNISPLKVSGPASDGEVMNNSLATPVWLYNGASYDRIRSALGANTGVQAHAGDSLVVSTTAQGALNADVLPATDARAYRWVSIQMNPTSLTGTVTFQGSNDNANWIAFNLAQQTSSTASPTAAFAASSTPLIFSGPVPYRYVRARLTAWTSGTVDTQAILYAHPSTPPIQTVAASVSAASMGDASTSGAIWPTGGMVYNGTNWDRMRDVASVNGVATATGLLGAGLVGFDQANYRRVITDTNGFLRMVPASGASAFADATTLVAATAVGNWLYNGATWDRLRGDTTNGLWANVKSSVLPTGASTETTLSAVNTKLAGTLTADVTDRSARLLGHVTVDNASIPVTGTFWQATQPVSAASLPLPTGASTETTLAAVNTKLAGTLATDPIDRAARLLGHVTVDNASIAVTGIFWQATQPVSAASLPLPTGASTEATLSAINTKLGGTLVVDTELPAIAALADATANPTTTFIGTGQHFFNGTTWDRARGDTTSGLWVNIKNATSSPIPITDVTPSLTGPQAQTGYDVSTSSTTAVAARAGRTLLEITNISDTPVFLGLDSNVGATVAATVNSGKWLAPNGGTWTEAYTGAVRAIHGATGTKRILIVEW